MEPGTQLGHYTIASLIGKGGMGEVYQAKDEKLGRQVAIKALPEEFAQDADRVARFRREAQLLASLNHPNIAAIHGLEETGGKHFLVLELVEGPTLADRIKQGAIPVEESLKLALQIAEALEAAHEKGVIHRDLKPANIKVTPDGKVKVLDFGLAKAFEGDAATNVSTSPTLSMAATQQGIILGTAAYMSPEQASGASTDNRADVWSFGVVLFEMLTGQQLFTGKTASHVMGAVLNIEPDWKRLPANLHPRIRMLLERSLEKEAKDRLAGISDARVDIQKVLADPNGVLIQLMAEVIPTAQQSKLPWVAASLAFALVVGLATWNLKPDPPIELGAIIRYSHLLGEETFTRLGRPMVAISRDGNHVAYVANQQLYLRNFNEAQARPVAGTLEDVSSPVFSPDGEWLGFWSNDGTELKRIPLAGGTPVTLTAADIPFGISWGSDGTVVYGEPEGIWQVPETGGTPELIVEAAEGEQVHGPQILPGGTHILYTVTSATGPMRWDEAQIVAESLDTHERTVLWTGGSDAQYVPTGHLVYALESNLLALRFDLETLTTEGGPVPIVAGTRRTPAPDLTTGSAQYDVSDNGTLVYIPGGTESGNLSLALLDRQGNAEVIPTLSQGYLSPRFSPDDTRIAVNIADEDGTNIWIYEIQDNLLNQLTFDGGQLPLWSPDGTEVTFLKDGALWSVSSDFSGTPTLLPGTDVGTNQGPGAWSPDYAVLLFGSDAGIRAWRRESAGADASEAAEVIVPAHDGILLRHPEFSPNGDWFVYTSNEIGSLELYANPYPVGVGARQRITTETGSAPVWVRNGQELIFQTEGVRLEAMEINTEPTLTRTNPTPLFSESELGANLENGVTRNYDVTADGSQFIALLPAGLETGGAASQLNVVLNWTQELLERVPIP